tara:strand:+ start:53 stop:337 length:285 start_codon:yes stop_codon:yes gene_type:complete
VADGLHVLKCLKHLYETVQAFSVAINPTVEVHDDRQLKFITGRVDDLLHGIIDRQTAEVFAVPDTAFTHIHFDDRQRIKLVRVAVAGVYCAERE